MKTSILIFITLFVTSCSTSTIIDVPYLESKEAIQKIFDERSSTKFIIINEAATPQKMSVDYYKETFEENKNKTFATWELNTASRLHKGQVLYPKMLYVELEKLEGNNQRSQ